VLAAVLLSQVNGLNFTFGPCPAITPVANFNGTAFAGKWFEIKGYPAEVNTFIPYKCSENRLKVVGASSMEVYRSALKTSDSSLISVTSNATFTQMGEGKLEYKALVRKFLKIFLIRSINLF
jgi:hypothetical protein